MRTPVDRTKARGAALAFVVLATVIAAVIWGIWRLFTGALNPSIGLSLPAAVLLLLSAHWVVAAIRRRSLDQERQRQLLVRKAGAYRLAIAGDPRAAAAELALWAAPNILRDYAMFVQERSRNPEAPFPPNLLAGMRRDLGHPQPDLDGADVQAILDGISSSGPAQQSQGAPGAKRDPGSAEMRFSLRYPGTEAGPPRGNLPPQA